MIRRDKSCFADEKRCLTLLQLTSANERMAKGGSRSSGSILAEELVRSFLPLAGLKFISHYRLEH